MAGQMLAMMKRAVGEAGEKKPSNDKSKRGLFGGGKVSKKAQGMFGKK